jgi:hypothetical protein
MRNPYQRPIYFREVNSMRLRIPDEIIELAKQHPDKKVEIY